MNATPSANRLHIGIYGQTNAGKSSLLNAITEQETSLVSEIRGTTTDPVTKVMELIPFGPVVFIDTAGLKDSSALGEKRMKASRKIMQRTDLALYIIDGCEEFDSEYEKTMADFKKHNIPSLTIVNKSDMLNEERMKNLRDAYPGASFVSTLDRGSILNFKDRLVDELKGHEKEPAIIGDILPYNSKVVMVVPIDSEAPKGRIILPQVQLIRDCLDHGIKSYVVRDTELEDALKDLNYDVDLVVTDSQAFKEVSRIVPEDIMLTSFSIVYARYKGDLNAFTNGINAIKKLNENSKVLISESCTHNTSHEDIGRVKIPKLLQEKLGFNLDFTFKAGHDFPEDMSGYDLIIHCGSCMLNKKTMLTRIQLCEEAGIPITNYGIVLAYLNGILDRSMEIFKTPSGKE
ncbi:[FeFe] hydrogenase H-cluster maturation GTPase HydF [Dethiosulfatibacter aminovorans]|uniref:[FeFe] hydrogenase H-cluster maturation GTPase HydF n=1 Tax=Dethiosulfatibacter aminovorans TaxID=332095 RepID=UPI0009351E80|nr:[FeFe] hydrogenase H-cluster maturation GTPase HydF [Dethiosulfatibacter aminovorans]